jgi:hypothetical protein
MAGCEVGVNAVVFNYSVVGFVLACGPFWITSRWALHRSGPVGGRSRWPTECALPARFVCTTKAANPLGQTIRRTARNPSTHNSPAREGQIHHHVLLCSASEMCNGASAGEEHRIPPEGHRNPCKEVRDIEFLHDLHRPRLTFWKLVFTRAARHSEVFSPKNTVTLSWS